MSRQPTELVFENQIVYLRSMTEKRVETRKALLDEKRERMRNESKVDRMTPYGEIDDLIEKWRAACQEALVDLQKRVNRGVGSANGSICLGAGVGGMGSGGIGTGIKMHQLLSHFHIDEQLIRFDRDNDDFY